MAYIDLYGSAEGKRCAAHETAPPITLRCWRAMPLDSDETKESVRADERDGWEMVSEPRPQTELRVV
jgi:hypothetical protein